MLFQKWEAVDRIQLLRGLVKSQVILLRRKTGIWLPRYLWAGIKEKRRKGVKNG